MIKSSIVIAAAGAVVLLTGNTGCDGDLETSGASASSSSQVQLAAMETAPMSSEPAPGPRPDGGFVTLERGGYTWVFEEDSPELREVLGGGELAKHVTRLHASGGEVITVKSPDAETLQAWLARKPGFATRIHEGYLWVFEEDAEELAQHDAGVELVKHVTRVAATPTGVQTVKGPDSETVAAYVASKPGFVARKVGEYLWIFREGSEALATVDAGGELAKHVTKINATPSGVQVLKGAESDVLTAYLATRDGYIGRVQDGYLWVFREGSPELAEVDAGGELAKHVTKIQATPAGVRVIKAPDTETLNGWLATEAGMS